MSGIRKATIYKLATAAHEADLDVMNGIVRQDENGRWWIGGQALETWLTTHAGEEVVFVMGSLEDDRPIKTRTCRTCGRDYEDLDCPTCRANRIRLRGHA